MKPNIVLLVIDTLRKDRSEALATLKGLGFVEYEAVAPSSWTLPSHVSMFTGTLPSAHGVRESPGVEWRELMGISKGRMSHDTLLDSLKEKGYSTYGSSANLFVTPQFGFSFDRFGLFDEKGEVTKPPPSGSGPGAMRRIVPLLFREGAVGKVLRLLVVWGVGTLLSMLGPRKLEKGSKHILRSIKDTSYQQPFFAFVNLMEAHNPYVHWALDTLVVRLAIVGLKPKAWWWRRMYPSHAELAVSRGFEVVSLFLPYDPLIVVVSDHGQLLGERGRYGHGFSLDEDLLRVPLLVRLPGGSAHPEVAGPLVGLSELRNMIETVADGGLPVLGSSYAVSETWEVDNYTYRGASEKAELHHIFSGKVGGGSTRVFSRNGSVLVTRATGAVEESTKGLTNEEALEMARQVPTASSAPEGARIPQSDEAIVLGRLKQLGYD